MTVSFSSNIPNTITIDVSSGSGVINFGTANIRAGVNQTGLDN